MKKITLLLSFIASIAFTQAQTNLVVNPSFETWTDGSTPDSWTIPANTSHVGSLTWSKETTITKDGTAALKLVVGTTQNPGIQQIIPITAGKTYTVSASYYVVSGDGTDVRIWSSFKNATGFYTTANWTTAVAADAQIQKILQGSGTDMAAYFTVANGTWGTYTADFVAPADATDFIFEVRVYKSSTSIWDKMSLVEKITGSTNNTNANTFKAIVSGKNLLLQNVQEGTFVEVFSALGSRVLSSTVANGKIDISTLSKGLYVVRVNSRTQKFLF